MQRDDDIFQGYKGKNKDFDMFGVVIVKKVFHILIYGNERVIFIILKL